MEKPFSHPNQPERGVTYWDWSLHPVRDEQGGVAGLLLGLLDVTERVKAQQERREGERMFRLLAETIEDVFWMSRPGISDMLYVSPAYEKVWGRSVESLYASPRSFIEAIHPEDRPGVLTEIRRHAMGRWDLEYRVVRPDGEVRWVRDRGFPLRDEQGSFVGTCGTASDITGLKEAEAAIRESEQRALELQERSLDGFARTDVEGWFLEVNQAFETLVGYSESELRHMTVEEITPEKWFEQERCMAESLRREGHTPLYEKEFRRKDGILVPVELRVHLSRDADGAPREMWAVVRDITERKTAEAELLENVKKLEQSNRALGDFAYVTSHDLQEPLRKIQTFGDRLSTKYGDSLDDRGRDYLERMVSAATRMRGLIEALLRYSRVSTRQQPFSEVDLNEAAQEALYNLEDLIERSGGTVDVGELPRVEGDPHQLVQLMQNLIGNALKFQRPGVPPAIRIEQQEPSGEEGDGSSCELHFEDNGIGFDVRNAQQIFKPFHRLHGRGEYEGAGMGLAICRKIVERHGGEIRVESQEGRGSVFVVTLPLKQSPAAQTD
jgi:PAS domain S-box-containing protein